MAELQDLLYTEALQGIDLGSIVNRRDVDVPIRPPYFSRFSRAFVFTNEQINRICAQIDHNGKRVLSIAVSDYMLTAIGQGCSEIIGIDISLISCFFAELKFAGAMELEYTQYTVFFGLKNSLGRISASFSGWTPEKIRCSRSAMFSERQYKKLRPHLSVTARTFFDSVIGYSYKNGREYVPLAVHYLDNMLPASQLSDFSYIRSERSYKNVKRKLRQLGMPLLLPVNIRDLRTKVQGKFDVIYLSNALDYYNTYGNTSELAAYLISITAQGGLIVGEEMLSGTIDRIISAGFEPVVQSTSISTRIFYIKACQSRDILSA